MDFLNSFVTAWEDETPADSLPDESRAPNVNVLLRKARQVVAGQLSRSDLAAETAALRDSSARSRATLTELGRAELEPAVAELARFEGLLNDLDEWSGTAADLDELRDGLVECGEALLQLQAQFALEGRDAPAPELQEDSVPVSPEVSRLHRLSLGLPATHPEWSQCRTGLVQSFRATLAQGTRALDAQGDDAELEELVIGLETVLAGLLGMGEGDDKDALGEGWLELLEGLRIMQVASGNLQARLP